MLRFIFNGGRDLETLKVIYFTLFGNIFGERGGYLDIKKLYIYQRLQLLKN